MESISAGNYTGQPYLGVKGDVFPVSIYLFIYLTTSIFLSFCLSSFLSFFLPLLLAFLLAWFSGKVCFSFLLASSRQPVSKKRNFEDCKVEPVVLYIVIISRVYFENKLKELTKKQNH